MSRFYIEFSGVLQLVGAFFFGLRSYRSFSTAFACYGSQMPSDKIAVTSYRTPNREGFERPKTPNPCSARVRRVGRKLLFESSLHPLANSMIYARRETT